MTSSRRSPNRLSGDTRSLFPDRTSHDRSESESRQPTSRGNGSIHTPETSRQSKSSSTSSSIRPSPFSTRSYKVVKGVARTGYYEDVYGAYPSTDEDREGGGITCESDSDAPILPRRKSRQRRQSKLTTAAPKSCGGSVVTQAAEKGLAQYGLKRSNFDKTCPEAGPAVDANSERAHPAEKVLLQKTEKKKSTPTARERYGLFGKVQPNSSRATPCDQTQESVTNASESPEEHAVVNNQNDDDVKIALAEFRQGKTFREQMEELEGAFSSNSRLPDKYRRLCPWWKGSDEPVSLEKVALHWRNMEELQNHDNQSRKMASGEQAGEVPPIEQSSEGDVAPREHSASPLSSLPTTTPEAPSASPSPVLQLEGSFRNISNGGQKRASEGPPEECLEQPAKKLRKDSGANVGEDFAKDMSPVDDDEAYETKPEGGESSVSNRMRRSDRRASNGTPLYRADQHPVDEFLDSSPKLQDERPAIEYINLVDSDDSDDDEQDEDIVQLPRQRTLRRRKTPPDTKTTESPSNSASSKKRGRMPGTRVVNGKLVYPSEEGSPSVSKSLDELTITTTKRTPIPSEKVRANNMYAATKKAPVQSKSTKANAVAQSKSLRDETPKGPKDCQNALKDKNRLLQINDPAETRRENGFIRGNTDIEEESSSSEELAITFNKDGKKKKISFHLPPKQPTPPGPESSGPLKRRLFR